MTSYEEMAQGLSNSSIYLALVTKNFMKDPTCATQLGLAVLLDKPIALVSFPDVEIPENLKRLAQATTEVKEESAGGMKVAVDDVMAQLGVTNGQQ